METLTRLVFIVFISFFITVCNAQEPIDEFQGTVFHFVLKTGIEEHGDSATEVSFYVNSKDHLQFRLHKYKFKIGSEESFAFYLDKEMDEIKNIKLAVRGDDMWLAESMRVRLFSYSQKKQAAYIFEINEWFSSEPADLKNDNTEISRTYNFE
jgi:hypothetical protein